MPFRDLNQPFNTFMTKIDIFCYNYFQKENTGGIKHENN